MNNIEPRPTQREIAALPNSTLIQKSMVNGTWRATYADAAFERMARGSLLLGRLDQEPPQSLNRQEFPATPLTEENKLEALKRAWSDLKSPYPTLVKEFAYVVTGTGWDYVDPAHRVKMAPREVEEFILSFIHLRDQDYYHDLPEGMQNLLGMIYDACGRWLMRNNRVHA